MGKFAVIDTETNWADQVMSIGTVIADENTLQVLEYKYHILNPEYQVGGMYSNTLFTDSRIRPIIATRKEAITDLVTWFAQHKIQAIFAYNASFDRNHLPELAAYTWYDIMRLAAYRQYNSKIPPYADCCKTGRLKRDYGVESMLRLLSGQSSYYETHNAIYDAFDELAIMRLLGHSLQTYIPLK